MVSNNFYVCSKISHNNCITKVKGRAKSKLRKPINKCSVKEDCKCEATKTPLYKLKKRLLAEKYGYLIKEITCDDF